MLVGVILGVQFAYYWYGARAGAPRRPRRRGLTGGGARRYKRLVDLTSTLSRMQWEHPR